MTGIFLMATQKIFEVILKIWPKKIFVFFQPQIEFRTQTNIFRKKFFCMQKLKFFVHSVVLDTIKLVFNFFSLKFFFQKR